MIDTRIDASRLSVLLDVRHPLAYLALHPTLAFAREQGLEINWLPLVVPPLKAPTQPGPDDDRGILHRRHRAHALAREIETYGAAQGLVLREYYRDPDPAALNLAWLQLREQHPERLEAFLVEAFRAYWALELDPSSQAALAALLDSQGGDVEGYHAFCAGEGPALSSALAEALRERGLSGVPCFLIEDEVFLGRQHLPMIRWILAGRVGRGPI